MWQVIEKSLFPRQIGNGQFEGVAICCNITP